jgi:hypothetical protein
MKYRASAILLGALFLGGVYAAGDDDASIEKRVQRIKDSDVKGWRKIPWISSLLAARRASEHEKRLLYVFTQDGNMETGRC